MTYTDNSIPVAPGGEVYPQIRRRSSTLAASHLA